MANPATEPITMPAIWPPDKPLSVSFPASVPVVYMGIKDVVGVGRSTPSHRLEAFAFTQQESVELTVLDAQNPHKPMRFDRKPHSLGSLSAADMQDPVREPSGPVQTAKSERIWFR